MINFLKRKTISKEVGVGTNAYLSAGSPTWAYVRNWATEQINELRARNDNINLDERKTLILRGRIQQLKELLELDKK